MSTILFDPIKTQSKITDSVIVSFSGGKDACVVLDLCSKKFKNIKAFFMYLVPNLSFQEETLQWYERRYNIEILRIPHYLVSNFLRFGSFSDADFDVPLISKNDIDDYVREQTGFDWIISGERAQESLERRGYFKDYGTTYFEIRHFYPIVYWNKSDVLKYVKFHKLKLSWEYQMKFKRSFSGLYGDQLFAIKNYYPEDYEKIKSFYPFVEATVKRFETYGQQQ